MGYIQILKKNIAFLEQEDDKESKEALIKTLRFLEEHLNKKTQKSNAESIIKNEIKNFVDKTLTYTGNIDDKIMIKGLWCTHYQMTKMDVNQTCFRRALSEYCGDKYKTKYLYAYTYK